jgi:uncharacterized membrane protein YcaP (DUF421 family)
MDPLRIAVRAAFAFVFLLVMVRLSGKHTVKQGTTFDFVLALILGDMIDDLLWAEVSGATFVVAVTALVSADLAAGAAASGAPREAR